MRAVDTNIVVRVLTRDDAAQAAAADAFIEDGAWIPLPALLEALWVLGRIYGKDTTSLITAIDLLLNHRTLVLQEADAVKAALELFRARPSLGFADCLILSIAKKAGHLPLGTFDRNLAKIEGTQRL